MVYLRHVTAIDGARSVGSSLRRLLQFKSTGYGGAGARGKQPSQSFARHLAVRCLSNTSDAAVPMRGRAAPVSRPKALLEVF